MGEIKFMDLLFSRYASPLDLMNLYIDQGRFGEFVEGMLELEKERKNEEAEKENERKLWSMFIHSMSDKSFNDWKKDVLQKSKQSSDENMTDDDVQRIMNKFFHAK